MLKAIATVVAGRGRQFTLQSEQQSSCRHCQHQSYCATGVLSKTIGARVHQWQLETDQPLSVGQQVELGLTERALVHVATLVYLLPLLGLLLGALLGQWLFNYEPVVIAISLLSALVAVGVSRRVARSWQRQGGYQPVILRVLTKPEANCGESFIER